MWYGLETGWCYILFIWVRNWYEWENNLLRNYIPRDIVLDLDYRFVNGYKRSPHNEILNISLKGENKYLMKNLNCKRCKSAFQNYVYMCHVKVSNSKISVFYIIWIALQALSTQLNKSISYFRECSSIMSYNQMSICNEK